ncbi:hemerythrin HHE cation binding domain-containing protein [Actinoallomurus bryophytorum]|uniref:Hemerythrin HHE cation binding domain-containing protein n=1 Tax=Actinoallomurus bryophytorum TaxID=1490222 RepID=A0A543CWP9_9ACTN|nr:hemerythrin domain-containing protein [Actinoallomurus bryophytorum]TQM01532.1 hemerythrin HHE cation binding domain-containing protein [Actinoallomurus bryophytorum]
MSITTEQFFDGREMFVVHAMFRREFGLMPELVRGVAAGDQQRMRVVAGHLVGVATVLHHHHRAEDEQAWPFLLERGSEDVARIVQLMEIQHANIDELAAEVDVALEAWRGGATTVSRDALADILERLVPVLDQHMRLEEERAVPLMEKYITAAEWSQMVRAGAAGFDADGLTLGFGMLMYEGDPEIVDLAVAALPPEARTAIRQRAARAFAAHSERVHGTATPPRSTEL